MRLDEARTRSLVSVTLVAFLAVIAIYLWFIDILTMQKQFGAFLAAELTALAMLLYLYAKPTHGGFRKQWFLAGCLFMAFCLALAIV
jgi:hypothetical protein